MSIPVMQTIVNLSKFYIKLEIKNLLLKNSPPRETEAENLCVYRYTCDERKCNLSYIEYTQCLLKQRFSEHAKNGSIKNLILEFRSSRRVRVRELLNNASILYKSNDEANLVKLCTFTNLSPTTTPRANLIMIY